MGHKFGKQVTALALVAMMAIGGGVEAAIKTDFGRLLTASYSSTAAIDSDHDLDCAPSATMVTVYVLATTAGTAQAYYLPLGGEAAVALDGATAIAANTLQTITHARSTRRIRYRFTPSSSTGSVWIDAFCGGPSQ